MAPQVGAEQDTDLWRSPRAIHQVMALKEKTRKKIGFEIKEPKTKYRKKRKKN
ncbi:MAG: hypothetical protein ISS66_09510 [Desulfobacteraceae bacterium]|nr:hypothetical protein [Desulfobacteraceae bacterium]